MIKKAEGWENVGRLSRDIWERGREWRELGQQRRNSEGVMKKERFSSVCIFGTWPVLLPCLYIYRVIDVMSQVTYVPNIVDDMSQKQDAK